VLHALHRIRSRGTYQLVAAHFNHGLRGSESDRDERFVRELCRRLKIELVVERAEGLKSANLEEHARELRYGFLNRAADAVRAQFIMLGHHRDDQAETVLLRLLRGAGIAGLGAMGELGPERLMRPLLSLDRFTILKYLAAIGADYVIDSSNFEDRATRNRLRRGLLPQLANDYSPGIARRLAELAAEMREVGSFIEAEARRLLDGRLSRAADAVQGAPWRMELQGFASVNRALGQAVLRELIRRGIGDLRRIERAHVDAMYRLAVGENPSGAVVLPRGWRLRREYDMVLLENNPVPSGRPAASAPDRAEISLKLGTNILDANGVAITLKEVAAHEPGFPHWPWHPPNRFEAYFDIAELPVLMARWVRQGDRIEPLGLCGTRKIQDVFVDFKVPTARRGSWPLVVSDNRVVWIPGLVRSRVALLTSASKKILHLRADLLPRQP
jgi:tRNA(Ile)-lysidine synthase